MEEKYEKIRKWKERKETGRKKMKEGIGRKKMNKRTRKEKLKEEKDEK